MWENISPATTRLAIRRLFAGYLFVSALALAFPHRPASWPLILAIHAAGIFLMLRPDVLQPIARTFPRTARVIGDWYLLILVPALYKELATLNLAVFNGRYFDSLILNVEQHLFGHQPSRELATALPYVGLSEFLHLAYISYYLIIYVPALYLYFKGRREAHQQLVFNLMLTFFAHYVFFIYFPVQGPRYLFPAPGGKISHGPIFKLTHRLLESGSSRGAAFPSSHVGVSFSQSAFAFRTMPRAAILLVFASTCLALGAIYGGFHYGTDALCGLAYGLLIFAVAPHVARAIGGRSA